ncbi:MAG: NAD-dependent epimerase/dehydratase family protein [Methanoculleaceae archaeon]
MRLLITGATGFTGRHLAEYCRRVLQNAEIHGTYLSRDPHEIPDTHHHRCDLRDMEETRDLIEGIHPDTAIHLAGLTHGSLFDLLSANAVGTDHLLSAIEQVNPECRVLVISSSAIYGYAGDDPITEDRTPAPLSAYGVSKLAQEAVALLHHRKSGVWVSIARPFNLIGPGLGEQFVFGKIISRVSGIRSGESVTVDLVGVDSRRDFVDVRDAVRAYADIVFHPRFGEECAGEIFNVGSGRATPVSDLIGSAESVCGLTLPLSLDPSPRPDPIPTQKADISRIASVTGWRPEISLDQSVKDALDAG